MFLKPFKKRIINEKGAISLEFLGVLPFLFLFLLLLWQVVAMGMAALSVQSAANEAAKVYAESKDSSEANQKAQNVIGSGDVVNYQSLSISKPNSKGDFKATLSVDLNLVFIPKQWKDSTSIPFSVSTSSRVME